MISTNFHLSALSHRFLRAVGIFGLSWALFACAESGPAREEGAEVEGDRATTPSQTTITLSVTSPTTTTLITTMPTTTTQVTAKPESEPKPIGVLDTKDGAWVKLFDKLPGKDEKPATKLHTVAGKVDVYEVYDWAEHHEEMRGWKGHVWYRVEPKRGHWVYGMDYFTYSAKKDAQSVPPSQPTSAPSPLP